MPEISELQTKIITQVEYYLSDINLHKDKFTRAELKQNDGILSFETLLKFNRLKAISEDVNVIKEALSKSKLLKVNDSGISRSEPFDFEDGQNILDKYTNETLYIKGFNQDVTLEQIETWFTEAGFKPKAIHMRKLKPELKFKGSIFATFNTREEAEKFLSCEKGAKFKDNITIRQWQSEFREDKDKEWKERGEEKAKKQELHEKAKRLEVESSIIKGTLLELKNLPAQESKEAGAKRKVEEDDEEEPKNVAPLKEFKDWLTKSIGEDLAEGIWVDMFREENRAIVRFKEENSAIKALEALKEKSLVYKEKELAPKVLEGEEEYKYWVILLERKNKKTHRRNAGHHGNFGGKKRRRG